MKDFLIKIANLLEIKDLDKFPEQEIERLILKRLEKRFLVESSLLDLSEQFADSFELSIRVVSSVNRIIDMIYSRKHKNIYEFLSYCFKDFSKILPIENISYVEKHPKWNRLILKVASGKIQFKDFKKKIFEISTTVCGAAFTKGEFIYIPDVKKDPRYDPKLSDLPIRTLLSVPVKDKEKDKVIGVINFSHPNVNAFSESCIFFLVSMVQTFSSAITLLKCYNNTLNFNEKLEKELAGKMEELVKMNKKLYQMSITDSLTSIYNKRYFITRLEEEFLRCLRYGNSFCLVIFDLDNLKKINDKFGHLEGDRLLKIFAKHLKNNIRKEDLVFRIGGDEFACIMVSCNLSGAKGFAERIKENFKSIYKKAPVTVSAGVGCFGKGEYFRFYKDYKAFFKEVDEALLKAKKTKDTVVLIETS